MPIYLKCGILVGLRCGYTAKNFQIILERKVQFAANPGQFAANPGQFAANPGSVRC